ncbi:MAG: EAL domain-containing protein [Gemmatimonadota bacterium]
MAAEALVRWRTADGTLLPPGEFIPIAEERGLIGAIGQQVLLTAARVAVECRAVIPHFVMGVNISASQLLTPGFVHLVQRALDVTGLDPDALAIEITEEVVLHDVTRAVHVLEELRRIGVWVAIDDFGTGYSSLSYLRDLPVNTVKVDRAFVQGIVGSERDRAVLRSIVQVAEALGMWFVAEGVETEAERKMLIDLGAELAQGYLVARPMAAEAFTAFMANSLGHR